MNTFSFKKIFLVISILSSIININAQSSITKNTSTVSNCGCPGETWSFTTPFKPKMYFPQANNSKRLMHTSYGFDIPATATITGIKVTFTYVTVTTPANTLKDSICTLILNDGIIGEDKSGTTGYYGNSGNITFGGPNDMWGMPQLTPANINSPSFGFNFKLYAAAGNSDFTFTNGAEMTIYYNLSNGISESQKSNSGINAYYHNKQLFIDSKLNERTELSIFNLSGMKVYCNTFESINEKIIDLSELKSDLYFYKLKSESGTKVAKFITE